MPERVYEVKCQSCRGVFAAALKVAAAQVQRPPFERIVCPWCEQHTPVMPDAVRPVRSGLRPDTLRSFRLS